MPEVRTQLMPPTASTVKELELLLQEAEQSGEPIEMTPAEWQLLRDDVEQDAAQRTHAL